MTRHELIERLKIARVCSEPVAYLDRLIEDIRADGVLDVQASPEVADTMELAATKVGRQLGNRRDGLPMDEPKYQVCFEVTQGNLVTVIGVCLEVDKTKLLWSKPADAPKEPEQPMRRRVGVSKPRSGTIGISTQDHLAQILQAANSKGMTSVQIAHSFRERGFAPSSWSSAMSYWRKAGKITVDRYKGTYSWTAQGAQS